MHLFLLQPSFFATLVRRWQPIHVTHGGQNWTTSLARANLKKKFFFKQLFFGSFFCKTDCYKLIGIFSHIYLRKIWKKWAWEFSTGPPGSLVHSPAGLSLGGLITQGGDKMTLSEMDDFWMWNMKLLVSTEYEIIFHSHAFCMNIVSEILMLNRNLCDYYYISNISYVHQMLYYSPQSLLLGAPGGVGVKSPPPNCFH